jgi:hypothetical protein
MGRKSDMARHKKVGGVHQYLVARGVAMSDIEMVRADMAKI